MEMRKFIIEMHSDGTLTCCDMEGGNTDHPNGCKKL